MLTFDSGPPLRPEGLAKEEHCLFLTPARLSDQKAWPNTASEISTCVSDRGCTEPLLTALLRLAHSEPAGTDQPGMPTR